MVPSLNLHVRVHRNVSIDWFLVKRTNFRQLTETWHTRNQDEVQPYVNSVARISFVTEFSHILGFHISYLAFVVY